MNFFLVPWFGASFSKPPTMSSPACGKKMARIHIHKVPVADPDKHPDRQNFTKADQGVIILPTPKKCTKKRGKSLKITQHVYCLIPPKWVPLNDFCNANSHGVFANQVPPGLWTVFSYHNPIRLHGEDGRTTNIPKHPKAIGS